MAPVQIAPRDAFTGSARDFDPSLARKVRWMPIGFPVTSQTSAIMAGGRPPSGCGVSARNRSAVDVGEHHRQHHHGRAVALAEEGHEFRHPVGEQYAGGVAAAGGDEKALGETRIVTQQPGAVDLRLQDIQLSYELIRSEHRKLPVHLLRFYVYANNVGILWKANHKGIDPDYVTGMPLPRTLALGTKINF